MSEQDEYPPQQQPLCHGQQISEVSSQSNLTIKSYGPDTDFWYVWTVTLTLEIWLWVKVMTHPQVMDINCVKYYPDPTWRSCGPDTDFWYVCTVTLTWEIWPWVKVMSRPRVMDNNCVIYNPDPTWQLRVMTGTQIFGMCALWPWPWRYMYMYDLGPRSWHPWVMDNKCVKYYPAPTWIIAHADN